MSGFQSLGVTPLLDGVMDGCPPEQDRRQPDATLQAHGPRHGRLAQIAVDEQHPGARVGEC